MSTSVWKVGEISVQAGAHETAMGAHDGHVASGKHEDCMAELLQDLAAGHNHIGVAQATQNGLVAASNLECAARVLKAVDTRLAHSSRKEPGLRPVRAARNDFRKRLAQALQRATGR